ncbi:MAG: polysaccharide biosynthesis/export family protein [Verrucomicrobia bacterium]|nr:polysaccharide biosynthesis/export family protein [Verrucomicrobiota bacterium]
MKNDSRGYPGCRVRRKTGTWGRNPNPVASVAMLAVFLWLSATGCRTPHDTSKLPDGQATPSEVVQLSEGDTVKISFPGAPDLETTQQIRRDGRISLPTLGEFKAVGLTPGSMEQELIKVFGSQLQTKAVNVTVLSSSFPIFVTGAVLRPGKLMSDRPMTAMGAIMEAGGFDYSKANLKAVTIIRQEDRYRRFRLDFKQILKGKEDMPFQLQPGDVIYVPERFTWF